MRRKVLLVLVSVLLFAELSLAQGIIEKFRDKRDIIKFFIRNLKHDATAIDSCITGYVLLKFDIGSSGKVSDICTIYSEHDLLKNEVLRVLKKSDGRWSRRSTGMDSGSVLLPVYFKIEDDNTCCASPGKAKNGPVPEMFPDELRMSNCYLVPRLLAVAYCSKHK
jgi:hypothetical protein